MKFGIFCMETMFIFMVEQSKISLDVNIFLQKISYYNIQNNKQNGVLN